MIIVGLSGNIGSGKTTFSRYLGTQVDAATHWESWQLIAEVATALRQQPDPHPSANDMAAINQWLAVLPAILQKATHKKVDLSQIKVTPERLVKAPENYAKLMEYLELMRKHPELAGQTINEATKETFRNILQWLGGYLVKTVSAGVWYDEILRRIQSADDLQLATIGGVRFPGDACRIKAASGFILEIRRPDIAAQDQQDLTERERNFIVADSIINNDGSLKQLEQCAARVVQNLQSQELQKNYSAASA